MLRNSHQLSAGRSGPISYILNNAQRSAEDPLATGMWRKAAPCRNAIMLRGALIRDVSRLQNNDCGDQSPEARADCRVQAPTNFKLRGASADKAERTQSSPPRGVDARVDDGLQRVHGNRRFVFKQENRKQENRRWSLIFCDKPGDDAS